MSAGGSYRAFNNVNSIPYASPSLKYPNLKMGVMMPRALMLEGSMDWVRSLAIQKDVLISWLSMSGPFRRVDKRQRSSLGYMSGFEDTVVTDMAEGLRDENLNWAGLALMYSPTASFIPFSHSRNSLWVWSATNTMLLYLHPLYTTCMAGPVKTTS